MSVDGPVDQGLLSPFWGIKASTPEFFRLFNSPTAVLAKMTPSEQILTVGDKLRVEFWISHFGPDAIRDRKVVLVFLLPAPRFPRDD